MNRELIDTLERADALLAQLEPIQCSDSDVATVAACRDVRSRIRGHIDRLRYEAVPRLDPFER